MRLVYITEIINKMFLQVVVLDHPGQPGGPLDISNVTKNGCELDWKAPGKELSNLSKRRNLQDLRPDLTVSNHYASLLLRAS